MTYLDLALLPARRLVVAGPDAFRNLLPQLPALPVALLLHRAHRRLLLRRRHVREFHARPLVPRDAVPLALKRVKNRRATRDCCFERVRFTREVTPSRVFDLR